MSFQRVELDQILFDEMAWSAHESVLDVGCDQGQHVLRLRDRVRRVVALDLNPAGPQGLSHAGVEAICGDAQQLPLTTWSFDTVLCHHVAFLFPRPDLAAIELARVCAPGGRVLISISNRRCPYQLVNAAIDRLRPGTGRPANEWSIGEWSRGLIAAGLVHAATYSCNLCWPLVPRIRKRWLIPNRMMHTWNRTVRRLSSVPLKTPHPHFAAHDFVLHFVKR